MHLFTKFAYGHQRFQFHQTMDINLQLQHKQTIPK